MIRSHILPICCLFAVIFRLAQVLQQSSCFLAGFVIAFYKGWELTLVILATLPVLMACGAFMGFVMAGANAEEQRNDGEAGVIAGEAISGIRTVAGLQYEDNLIKRYIARVSDSFVAAVRKGWMQGVGIGAFMLVIFSVYGLGLWYGSVLLRDGKDRWPGLPYTGGDVVAIFYALITATMGVSQAAPHFAAIVTARCAARPLYDVIDRVSKIDALDRLRGKKLASVTGDITLERVTFTYPSRLETQVLKDLSLSFASGQTIALVGASGCGKSTIMQLIERFYDPDQERVKPTGLAAVAEDHNADGNKDASAANATGAAGADTKTASAAVPVSATASSYAAPAAAAAVNADAAPAADVAATSAASAAAAEDEEPFVVGRVLVRGCIASADGPGEECDTDLRELNVASWREHVGMVAQEPVLFAGTIKENILYGRPDATDDEIRAATIAANAHGFISKMKKGYDTYVGEGGRLLSGGQKQRVAIARALVKNPRILLLDEATSALDTESERIVQRALDKVIGDKSSRRTTLVIAHRLSTIKNADRIVVFDMGRIVEDGTHDELLVKGGLYASMVHVNNTDATGGANGKAATAAAGDAGTDLAKSDSAVSASNNDGNANDEEDDEEDEVVDEDGGDAAAGAAGGSVASTREHSRVSLSAEKTTGAAETRITIPEGNNTSNASNDADGSDAAGLKGDDGSNKDDAKPLKSGMPGLLRYARHEWFRLSLGILFGICEGVSFPLYSLLMSKMTDSFYFTDTSKMMDVTRWYAFYFFLLGLGAGTAVLLRSGLLAIAGEEMVQRVRGDLFKAIMRQEIGWHDREANAAGVLQTKLSADALHVRNIVTMRLGLLVSIIANVCAGFIICFVRGWQMAVIMLAVFPALAGAGVMQFMFVMGFGSRSKKAIERAGQVATESVANIRTLASFNGELALLQRFSASLQQGLDVGLSSAQFAGIGFGGANFIIFAAYALCFWYGGRLVYREDITFETMLQVFLSFEMSCMMVGQLFQILPDFDKVSAAVADVIDIIDRDSAIDYSSPAGEDAPVTDGEIRFENVFFHYPTRPDIKVLRGLSFTATGKRTLAIVGESGSGKSTVFSLIQRFYDPVRSVELPTGSETKIVTAAAAAATADFAADPNVVSAATVSAALAAAAASSADASVVDTAAASADADELPAGRVTIDGTDLTTMRLAHLRSFLGIVGQEPTLFSGTIADNIRCGDREITQDMIESACKLANLHDLISRRFPRGYKTQVGPKGAQLSGGQKQRVAIARAIVRQPKVLLLDEATSALDSRAERLVQDALNKAMEGRTTVLIAHRLDTVKHADAIILVAEGKVAEGPATHDELVALDGKYAKLVAAASLTGSLEAADAKKDKDGKSGGKTDGKGKGGKDGKSNKGAKGVEDATSATAAGADVSKAAPAA